MNARRVPASDVKGGDFLVCADAEVFDAFPDNNDRTIVRVIRDGDAQTAYVFPSTALVAIR